ncbi:MAG: SUMF1/EgtB/PvdO family nonheme iron enzyme, partial [Treponema sp.]|nr:SUMF1/EgtB/PvdO family nonheme iron enzyme [Treponema sp.]
DTNTSGTFSWDKTKNGYRLPTECEWEFAAGGGDSTTHDAYTYSGSNTIEDVAWYSDNSGSEAHPVGTKKANALGIYDMSGNVAEYCYDYYASFGTGELTNPVHESGRYRTIKGGSLKNNATIVKILTRSEVSTNTSGWYNTTSNSSSASNSYSYVAGIRFAKNAE